MSSREQLIENYEDALFALMMDDIAQSEGERLLRENAVLKNEAGASVPPGLHKRCLQTIRSALLRQKSGASVRFAGRLLVRLAAAVFVTAALFSAAFAASPSFRATTLNLLIEINDDLIQWSFDDEITHSSHSNSVDSKPLGIEVTWLPEDYILIDEAYEPFNTTLTYQNSLGDGIYISLLSGTQNTVINTDKEDADHWEEFMIHDTSAIAIEKSGTTSVLWFVSDTSILVDIYSDNLPLDQLRNIAEGVTVIS